MNTKLTAVLSIVIGGVLLGIPAAGAVPSSVEAPAHPVSIGLVAFASAEGSDWHSPVPTPLIIGRKFDPPDVRWHSGHRGVDVCPGVGTVIRAPRAGSVVYAGPLAGVNVVSIRHEDGLRTTFQPVDPWVFVGQWISAGAAVGVLEPGHQQDCLHWGVKLNRDTYLNPVVLLAGRPILKPWDEPGA